MDKTLLKESIKEVIDKNGGLIVDYWDSVVPLWIDALHKNCVAYYSVEYTDDDYISYYEILKPLSKEQIEEIKQASVIDGEECDYDEVLDQFSESHLSVEGTCGEYLIPMHIDLNTAHYLYDVDIVLFPNGINNTPKILKRNIELNDEEYAWLLRKYVVHSFTSFNEIRTLKPDLFNKMCGFIEENIEDGIVQIPTPTYAVELTGIKEHAKELDTIIREVLETFKA